MRDIQHAKHAEHQRQPNRREEDQRGAGKTVERASGLRYRLPAECRIATICTTRLRDWSPSRLGFRVDIQAIGSCPTVGIRLSPL